MKYEVVWRATDGRKISHVVIDTPYTTGASVKEVDERTVAVFPIGVLSEGESLKRASEYADYLNEREEEADKMTIVRAAARRLAGE